MQNWFTHNRYNTVELGSKKWFGVSGIHPLWRWGRGYMNNGRLDPKECVGGAYQASVILSISPLKGLE